MAGNPGWYNIGFPIITLKPKAVTKSKKQGQYFLFSVIVLALSGCLHEDDKPVNPVSEQDKSFVSQATFSNQGEIRTGQLAISKAINFSVKEFGEMMVTDHTNAQDQLSTIAESLDVGVPDTLNNEQELILAQLSELEGAAFDS